MSELHMQYSEICAIPQMELQGITQAFIQMRKHQHEMMNQKPESENTLDCETVNQDDIKEWFK